MELTAKQQVIFKSPRQILKYRSLGHAVSSPQVFPHLDVTRGFYDIRLIAKGLTPKEGTPPRIKMPPKVQGMPIPKKGREILISEEGKAVPYKESLFARAKGKMTFLRSKFARAKGKMTFPRSKRGEVHLKFLMAYTPKEGIGTKLVNILRQSYPTETITLQPVQSAKGFYKKLGFKEERLGQMVQEPPRQIQITQLEPPRQIQITQLAGEYPFSIPISPYARTIATRIKLSTIAIELVSVIEFLLIFLFVQRLSEVHSLFLLQLQIILFWAQSF